MILQGSICASTGSVTICTLGSFLKEVTVRISEEQFVQYNQLIKTCITDGEDIGDYIRKGILLRRRTLQSLGDRLVKLSSAHDVPDKTSIVQAVEDLSVECMAHFGNPTQAVLLDGKVIVANPADFILFMYFDDSGRAYGNLVCVCKNRSFYTATDKLDKASLFKDEVK